MAILRRRRKEDVEESYSKSGKKGSGQKDSKKKKGSKSWGRKERLLVFWVLLITTLISSILALSARSWSLPGLPKISFPFFKTETIVIEGNKIDQEKARDAKEAFEAATRDLSGVYGFQVIRLDNGSSYGLFENEVFQAASLIKLPVIAAAYIEVEEGNLDLETKYALKNEDKISGAGSLDSKEEGTILTYRDLLRLMGKESDNTAFGVISGILGNDKVDQAIAKIGMNDTSFEENETTPRDIGIFFQKLWDGEVVSKKYRDEILFSLTDTAFEAWIKEGIPNTRVAHKYGREVHVVNDAGIVFSDNPYVLVILTKGVIEREADEIFPELARIVHEIETR